MKHLVDAVVVTYLPDRDQLKRGLDSLKAQVRNIIVVSNGPDNFEDLGLALIHISLEENLGIGAAQNRGVLRALELGADWILTSDQDTVFPAGYVASMVGEFMELISKEIPVGALGPVFRDRNRDGVIHPMVLFGRLGLKKVGESTNPQPVSHFISSGMLIPAGVFGKVGYMREDFFMDWIDTEWCWRARSLGFQIFQIPTQIISHELGQHSQSYLGVAVTAHSKKREYYKIRNAISLMMDSDYRSFPVWSYLTMFIIKSLVVNMIKGFSDPRYFQVVFASLSDGILGRRGKGSVNTCFND